MFVPARVPSLFVLFGRGVASVASAVSRRLERTGGRPGRLRQRCSGRVPFSDVDAPEERSILHRESEGKPVADRARAREVLSSAVLIGSPPAFFREPARRPGVAAAAAAKTASVASFAELARVETLGISRLITVRPEGGWRGLRLA